MFSKLFGFGKKPSVNIPDTERNFSFLSTDMHSHLVPGIDDGAQTIDDSIELIQKLMAMGFRSIITTPHIKTDHYPNNKVTIGGGMEQLKAALTEKGIQIPIKAAAEYYIDEYFMQLLANKELLTIRDNEVLVEISFMAEPLRFHDILFQMQTSGYRPILAHPERYIFYHQRPETYRELKNKGCLLQLNTIALTGYYGKPVKQIAEYLLKERLYDYCGSDMHHIKHAETLERILDSNILESLIRYPFLNNRLHTTI
jgi:Capsular polysaccharide biosynthesis protein